VKKNSAASDRENNTSIGWGTGSEGLNVNLDELEEGAGDEGATERLDELEEDAGDEGVTERKVYTMGYSSELLSNGLTGASRRPMRLHEFQVSPFFLTEEGRRSIDMRYATLSGSPELHPPPPPPL
jgi:hypothetical protein